MSFHGVTVTTSGTEENESFRGNKRCLQAC